MEALSLKTLNPKPAQRIYIYKYKTDEASVKKAKYFTK